MEELIGRYRKLDAADDQKIDLIREVEDLLPDDAGYGFLLGVLRDSGEHDLARIEAIKVLRLQDAPAGRAGEFARALEGVLSDRRDDAVVRSHAMMAIQRLPDVPASLVDVVVDSVLNTSDDLNVRGNGLSIVEANCSIEKAGSVFEELQSDSQLGRLASAALRRLGDHE